MKCMWILFNHAVKMSANFVWNTCEKSMIAVGNVVIGFGHIVQLIY